LKLTARTRLAFLSRAGLAAIFFFCLLAFVTRPAAAGPPFETDDPDPVACHHVEIDVADGRQSEPAKTGPIWEADYGPTQNVEVSVGGQPGETAVASAYRFIDETKDTPEVGFLPELTVKSDGETETFLPFWAQKTTGDWTFFGGGGVSHGDAFTGITATRNFRSGSSLGIEFYHETQRNPAVPADPRVGLGWTDQLDSSHALMTWVGRTQDEPGKYFFYLGFQVIISPKGHASNCPDSPTR
jgi:hypothetical protein